MFALARAMAERLGFIKHRTRQQHTRDEIERLRGLGMRIGENVALVDCTFDTLFPSMIEIGSNCLLTGTTVLAHDASPVVFGNHTRVAPVRILDSCFVGAGAIVLPGVTIGPRAIVGANAVVSRDVPEGKIVAGNPARVVADVTEWLTRKEAAGELIPWTGGVLPDDAEVNAARAFVRQRFGQ